MNIGNVDAFVGRFLLLVLPMVFLCYTTRSVSFFMKLAVTAIGILYAAQLFQYFIMQGGSNYGILIGHAASVC